MPGFGGGGTKGYIAGPKAVDLRTERVQIKPEWHISGIAELIIGLRAQHRFGARLSRGRPIPRLGERIPGLRGPSPDLRMPNTGLKLQIFVLKWIHLYISIHL